MQQRATPGSAGHSSHEVGRGKVKNALLSALMSSM